MQAQVHEIPNASTANSSLDQDEAATQLKSVRLYAFGGVGFAGRITPGEAAFRKIMSAPKDRAVMLLSDVWHKGSPEAKAYALAGLQELSATLFQQFAAESRMGNQPISVAHGCILSRSTLKQVAEAIAKQGSGLATGRE